jgi:Fe-S-cluster containining protein
LDFECHRCGLCCRNLIETKNNFKRGLPLTEKEANIFSKELVSPKLGIGIAEPNIVVLYQLNVNVCPLINDKNECSKYEYRPLMCRSFPVVAGAISNRCRVFSYRQVGVSYIEPFSMTKQLEASNKFTFYLQNRIKKYYQRNLKVWEYDLSTRKWVCLGLYDAL